MEITTVALILSIAGIVGSLFLAGGIISVAALVLSVKLFMEEKSIRVVRALSISVVGAVLPIIMYLNTYGFGLPQNDKGVGIVKQILVTNYSELGLIKDDAGDLDEQSLAAEKIPVQETDGDMVYISNMGEDEALDEEAPEIGASQDYIESDTIFESLDSIDPDEKLKGGIVNVAASDDDMPSYGGMPLGVQLLAQYFREDDHNCNPVLVLRNATGQVYRFECRFTARDKNGNEMAFSDKTVEAVQDGNAFIFEGRFDKKELGGGVPDSYEFLITKREPYERDMADEVSVYTRVVDNSAILTADNESDRKVKVDAYVLFFDKGELVDCMWMIPQNTDEVCLDPGTMASIRGDAYYRFDRVETYYTAYEAVGE